MRILHLITRLILGGAQENTILNCQGLSQQFGDEVLLLTGPGLGPEGSLEEDARSRGITLQVLSELRRPINLVRDFKSLRQIRSAIDAFQPDIVHTHSGKGGLLGRWAARQASVRGIVHTVHGAPFHPYQAPIANAFFRRCEKFAAKRCHAIISVADAMTDQLVAANVAPRSKFTTIYSGMETTPFLNSPALREPMRRQLGYRPDDIVVAKVARLFHLKGHHDLIAGAGQAIADLPRLKFLLVGEGILRDELTRLIHANGLQQHFQLVGLRPPSAIPGLLAASDIVVHTSLREGLARVLPQALLSGKPVVSYDIDGAREVVSDNQTGFLIPAGDVRRLSEALIQLAQSAELRQRFGRAGELHCRERFDHRTMTRQIRTLYRSVLDGHQG